jgi:HTH-type transcriptional regulator / antitoxin HigA
VTPPYPYQPAELVPAGQTLADWLDRARMSQADFAKRTSLTSKHINQVVKGGVGISAEVALAFERVTSIPARYWLQLDANYYAAKQRIAEARDLETDLDLVDLFPIRALEQRGAIERVGPKLEKLRELLRFFGVADTKALREVSLAPTMFRLSPAFEASQASLAAWLRLAEQEATSIPAARFDAPRCRDAIDEMRALSQLPGVEWLIPLRTVAASAGIAIVVVEELPKCRVNGATRWLTPDKAMIALSLRHRRNDIFWFTLFHELCHVLRHSKKRTFIDGAGALIARDLEDEADLFAERILIPPHHAGRLGDLKKPDDVIAFAREIGVAPGIVVGRMQHDGYIEPNQMTSLFDRYRFTNA